MNKMSHAWLFLISISTLLPLTIPTSALPTAVYLGAAVAQRGEHDRSYRHQRARTSASRTRPSYVHTDDEPEAVTEAIRSSGGSFGTSSVPLNIRLELANNVSSFVKNYVSVKNDAERQHLQAWATKTSAASAAASTQRRPQVLFAEASRRKTTNKHGDHSSLSELSSFDTLAMLPNDDQILPGRCEPMLTVVRVPLALNHSTLMYPDCVKVRRCSNCCTDPLMQCKPTHTYKVETEVHMFLYTGSQRMTNLGNRPVQVDVHDRCECQCQLEAKDCHPSRQTFDENACQCRCRNEFTDAGKCTGALVWSPNECRCTCAAGILAASRACPYGMRFDDELMCDCVPT